MKIEYKIGDLLVDGLADDLEFIAHGCNAQGVMGSGIARSIKDKWPVVFEEYQKSKTILGGIVTVQTPEVVDINCITQEFYGRDKNVVYCSYEEIRSCIQEIDSFICYLVCLDRLDNKPVKVGMPMIGAGLANGDWDIISKIIEEESRHFQPVVYKLP